MQKGPSVGILHYVNEPKGKKPRPRNPAAPSAPRQTNLLRKPGPAPRPARHPAVPRQAGPERESRRPRGGNGKKPPETAAGPAGRSPPPGTPPAPPAGRGRTKAGRGASGPRAEETSPFHDPESADALASYLSGRGGAGTSTGDMKARFVSPFAPPEDAARDLEAFLSAVSRCSPSSRPAARCSGRTCRSYGRSLPASGALRPADYMGRPSVLAAYVRYFMAWNIVRWCRSWPAFPWTSRREPRSWI